MFIWFWHGISPSLINSSECLNLSESTLTSFHLDESAINLSLLLISVKIRIGKWSELHGSLCWYVNNITFVVLTIKWSLPHSGPLHSLTSLIFSWNFCFCIQESSKLYTFHLCGRHLFLCAILWGKTFIIFKENSLNRSVSLWPLLLSISLRYFSRTLLFSDFLYLRLNLLWTVFLLGHSSKFNRI